MIFHCVIGVQIWWLISILAFEIHLNLQNYSFNLAQKLHQKIFFLYIKILCRTLFLAPPCQDSWIHPYLQLTNFQLSFLSQLLRTPVASTLQHYFLIVFGSFIIPVLMVLLQKCIISSNGITHGNEYWIRVISWLCHLRLPNSIWNIPLIQHFFTVNNRQFYPTFYLEF